MDHGRMIWKGFRGLIWANWVGRGDEVSDRIMGYEPPL